MTVAEIRFFTFDGPIEPNCLYCGLPASGVMVGGLHEHCHEAMNRELESLSVDAFDVEHDGGSASQRDYAAEAMGY